MKYNVGDKIRFAEERNAYTVRACDDRYLICTKPFNIFPNTVVYTIVDLKEGIRGTDGYSIGPYSYYSDEDCNAFLKELQEADALCSEAKDDVIIDIDAAHISYRNRIKLNIKNGQEIF